MAVKQPCIEHNPEPIPLSSMPVGGCGRIDHLDAENGLRQRLMEMGFLPGTIITVDRCGPLGDPVSYSIRGYHVSLRREEADLIWVTAKPCKHGGPGHGRRRRFRGGFMP